jgi:hypothetical protein
LGPAKGRPPNVVIAFIVDSTSDLSKFHSKSEFEFLILLDTVPRYNTHKLWFHHIRPIRYLNWDSAEPEKAQISRMLRDMQIGLKQAAFSILKLAQFRADGTGHDQHPAHATGGQPGAFVRRIFFRPRRSTVRRGRALRACFATHAFYASRSGAPGRGRRALPRDVTGRRAGHTCPSGMHS